MEIASRTDKTSAATGAMAVTSGDVEYFKRRLSTARARAEACQNRAVAALHSALADLYEQRLSACSEPDFGRITR